MKNIVNFLNESNKFTRDLVGSKIKMYAATTGQQFEIPNKIWYVWKDHYRNCAKIGCYGDLAQNTAFNAMYVNERDCEDFSPSDILYATDDLKDAIKWLCDNGCSDKDAFAKLKDNDADFDKINFWSEQWAADVLSGDCSEEDSYCVDDKNAEKRVATFDKFKKFVEDTTDMDWNEIIGDWD